MTVISMIPNDTPYLPPKVTEVPKDTLRNFPHSKKVGNYLLGSTLGEGSFAKVKEALHIPTGERVAVKIIDKKKSRDDSYVRKNLRREGKILQMIRHDNIIQLLEIMETQNSYYLVTEMCKGGDLMDYISQKRKLPENEVKKYIRQIVSAVDYLHRLGILHRDLKIENLLLDESKDIKIIDFGLSNCVKLVQTKEGPKVQEYCVTQCGSPAYAAPELLGRKKYGPQVDVWSIGVNMYAMLTGNLPFTVEPFNIKALHNKMITGQMNPLPEAISRECRDIIKKLLNPDPDRRIPLEEILKHSWIAEGPGQPLPRSACPNRLRTEALENSILKHMSENQGYRVGEVIRFVTGNVPSSATAMYYLIYRKLVKHFGNLRASGKIAADHRILQRTQFSTDAGKTSPKVFSSQRAQRTQNNTPVPAAKTINQTTTRDCKENNENETEKDVSKEGTDDKSGTEDGFTDILQTKGTNVVVQIPRASPSHKKENIGEKYTSAQLRVSNKYVSGRKAQTTLSCEQNSVDNKSDRSASKDLEKQPGDVCENEEDEFRPRASTFPGKLDRPDVLLEKLLKEQNNDESKEKTNGAVKMKTNKNKSDTINISNKESSDANKRGTPYQRELARSPAPRAGTGQTLVQFRKHPSGVQRRIIRAQKPPDNVSEDSIQEDEISVSTIKHILSRPSKTKRFIRVPPVNNNVAHDERAVLEHVSEILSARIGSPRPSNFRSATPMLPMLSPNFETGKRT